MAWDPTQPGSTAQADDQYAPVVAPTITGSRGGNVALTNLLAALANAKWIVDNTTS